jgi:hypothetical protein
MGCLIVNRLTEVEAAYVACAIDGEGSVRIEPPDAKKNRRYYYARIQIFNTNLPWLTNLQKIIGGSIHLHNLHPERSKIPIRNPEYRVEVCRMVEVLDLLRQVRPFLIIKAEKADWAMNTLVVRQVKHNWQELAEKFRAEGNQYPSVFLMKNIGCSNKGALEKLKRAASQLS